MAITPVEAPNILGSYVQGMEFARQNRMERAKETALLAQQQREAELRNYLATSPDLTTPAAQNALLRFGKPGAELAASMSQVAAQRGALEKTQYETLQLRSKMADENYGRFQKTLGDLAYGETAPTKQQVIDQITFLAQQGTIAPQFVDFATNTLSDDPRQLQAQLRGQFISQIPPAERAELFVPMSPEKFAEQAGLRSAGAARTSVLAYTPASEKAQSEFMASSRATYDQLKSAGAQLENFAKARRLAQGEARKFMGKGGDALLSAASFLNNRLGFKINTKGVTEATELRSTLFQGILDNLRKLDAQPSQEQQRIMQEALGSLDTDPNALGRVLDVAEDVLRNRVATYNAEVTSAEQRGVRFPYDPVIKLPPRSSLSAKPVEVRTPEGQVFTFPDQASADKFRSEAGL